jgi:hypothetical protein
MRFTGTAETNFDGIPAIIELDFFLELAPWADPRLQEQAALVVTHAIMESHRPATIGFDDYED